MRLFVVCFLALFAAAGSRVARAEVIGDRLVIDVNGTHYTQRQIEAYYLVRVILSQQEGAGFPRIDAKNWPQIIDMFRVEILVEQEALRLGSFRPVDRAITHATDIFMSRVKQSAHAENMMKRLGLTGLSLTRTLTTVLRADALRRNKERQMEAEGVAASAQGETPLWLRDLNQRSVHRTFEGADVYKEIQPTMGRTAPNVL